MIKIDEEVQKLINESLNEDENIAPDVKAELNRLHDCIMNDEELSYDEIHYLQCHQKEIKEMDDLILAQWAGIPEEEWNEAKEPVTYGGQNKKYLRSIPYSNLRDVFLNNVNYERCFIELVNFLESKNQKLLQEFMIKILSNPNDWTIAELQELFS